MTYEELKALNDKAYNASRLIVELSQMLGAYFANNANLETRLAEVESRIGALEADKAELETQLVEVHMKINEIALGAGNYIINHGTYGDCAAVFIEPAPQPGTVGTDASDSGLPNNQVAEGATVIAFYNLASIDALLAELAQARNQIGARRGLKPIVEINRQRVRATPKGEGE